jgi:hypothetical protein
MVIIEGAQAPLTQVSLGLHFLLQPPHAFGLVSVSTHAPSHDVSVPVHAKLQLPALQVGVPPAGAVHAVPQVPQFAGSRLVSTHEPWQLVDCASQTSAHVPSEQL